MEVINTIIPIFAVIFLGLIARKTGLMPVAFLGPANRLTYYLAVPALMFRALARGNFTEHFDIRLLIATLAPLFFLYGAAWLVCIAARVPRSQRGTLVECVFHGNIGYIGLAVVFYYLGTDGLTTASVLAGFMMLAHNFLAIIVLQANAPKQKNKRFSGQFLLRIIGNPIIVTAVVGIFFSISPLTLPAILDRTIDILGNLALPLALLIIGASLGLQIQQKQLVMVTFASLVKLLILPALGLWLYRLFDLPPRLFLPGLILLCSPVATVAYILATQLHGDSKMAGNAISISTALSLITITFWLSLIV